MIRELTAQYARHALLGNSLRKEMNDTQSVVSVICSVTGVLQEYGMP